MSGTDYASRVPHYTFSDTLAEQEAELEANPLLRRMIASRKAKSGDPHRPFYHYVNPENMLNDPNGLCFWQGRWHLFYQGYPPEDPRVHWGHAVSDDLIHWRDLPYAIYPGPERDCYSGATLVEEDRVIAMYHGTQVGNMVAVSSDPLLLNWEKETGQPVIPIPEQGGSPQAYTVFDPCIWKKDGVYYALSAGTLVDEPGGKRSRGRLPLPLGRPRELGVPASVHRRRPVHAGGRRRRLPVLLADWRQAHPALLQPHERRAVPPGRLRQGA